MGSFTFHETELRGVYRIDGNPHGDHRGYFMECYQQADFRQAGLEYDFVQDNLSFSQKGVLRGLHFQRNHPQAKLMLVLQGAIFDVAVDLRKGSETYGQWHGEILSGENHRQLLIPRGFAHGFLVLSDTALLRYKCDDFYHPEDEGGIVWNDPTLAVAWPDVGEVILSEKDRHFPTFRETAAEL